MDGNLEWRKQMRHHKRTLQTLQPITAKIETPNHNDVTR